MECKAKSGRCVDRKDLSDGTDKRSEQKTEKQRKSKNKGKSGRCEQIHLCEINQTKGRYKIMFGLS